MTPLLSAALIAFVPMPAVVPTAPEQPATVAQAPVAPRPDPAGTVVIVDGDVQFYDAHNTARRPKVGDPIYPGESIVTGSDGEVQLSMADDGYIGVRPGTEMRITDYKAQGGPDDRSIIGLLRGSFRAVTGWIGRYNRQNITVQTPTATIGVRGTDHEPLVIPEGSALGDPGTYDRVYQGETDLRTAQGSVRVKPNQAAFASREGRVAPRVLAHVPAFFRPTRNEARFRGLHDRIQRQLEQKRKERIQHVQRISRQERQRLQQHAPRSAPQRHERPQERLREQRQAEPQNRLSQSRAASERRAQFAHDRRPARGEPEPRER
ncbi:MAG TPA: FecR domain-containing protein [Burkholderiales bacterium]|nr:FecR domain-containing protein [Burkholderiales bacterium]